MGLTANLAEAIAATRFSELPPDVVEASRQLILDGIAVAVAGSREKAPRLLATHHRAVSKEGTCSLVGLGARLSPVAASCVNGASMHVLDFEPMWSPANHAVSTAVPVALAIAQLLGRSGEEIIAAVVIGCEVQGRLRAAQGVTEASAINFHPPGVVGPLGAAATAGYLLGLSADKLVHAIGIAASGAGTLLANAGTMTKCLHTGRAAAIGTEAALLAKDGFMANPEILDVSAGYFRAFMPDYNARPLEAFGSPFRVIEPGFAIKLFPSQYGTHFAINAALEARSEVDKPSMIKKVLIEGPEMPYVNRPFPQAGLEGKFSFQYTAAAAILDGRVDIASFTDERLRREDMQRLLPLVEFRQTPGASGYFEDMHVQVTIERRDGPTSTARCDAPKGYLKKGAPITIGEHLAKVRSCLRGVMSEPAAEELIGTVSRFEYLSSSDIDRMMKLVEHQSGNS